MHAQKTKSHVPKGMNTRQSLARRFIQSRSFTTTVKVMAGTVVLPNMKLKPKTASGEAGFAQDAMRMWRYFNRALESSNVRKF